MSSVINFKQNNTWRGIPAMRGPKGDKGDRGDSGTSDYPDLTNKPSIEGVTLSGNKTASDLGLAKSSDIPDISGLASKSYVDNMALKTINGESIKGSGNIVIQGGSGGTTDYSALSNKPSINNVTLSGNKSLADLGINNFDGNYNSLTNKPTIPTTSDIDTEVQTYWNAHKSELKGDKGDTGNTYTITSADYDEIATVVYDMLTNAEDQEV